MAIKRCPRCTGALVGGVHTEPCDPTELVLNLESQANAYRTTLEQIASLPPERVHEATSLAYFRLHPEQEPEG